MKSTNTPLIPEVLDRVQLSRIESVHGGFLYQHLYSVACLLNLGLKDDGVVRIEGDEDVEIIFENLILYVQVKTRNRSIIKSDIDGSLERFAALKEKFSKKYPERVFRFSIVANQKPGPQLSNLLSREDWPKDVEVVFPELESKNTAFLPPAWSTLDHAITWCKAAADKIPFATLSSETLIWKLAALVQFAATGQDRKHKDHIFYRSELPFLFEQLVIQLQEFPTIPEDYKPQKNEPDFISDSQVRLVVGFSGAGKTVWASWQAHHTAAPTAYFDIGDLPGSALAGSLARELAARFLGAKETATKLPALSGIDLLAALSNQINLPEPPLVVLDNIHRLNAEDIRTIVNTCRNIRFILIAQPWRQNNILESFLNIQSEELNGWDEDTIASVFQHYGAVISPQAAHRWKSITAGVPLFVKNAALLTVQISGGNATAFADQVEQGKHPKELTQEAILNLMIDNLSQEERSIISALSFSVVPLSRNEIESYFESLPKNVRRVSAVLRSLNKKGILQVFTNEYIKLHDAFRLVSENFVTELSEEEIFNLQVSLRDVLLNSLLKEKDLKRFGAWLRLLHPTGQVETLVDIATVEYFHEFGEPHDIKEILHSVAEDIKTSPYLRFWTLDALLFWMFQELGQKHLPKKYLIKMADIVNSGAVGDKEKVSLLMKQIMHAGLSNDRREVEKKYKEGYQITASDPFLHRLMRYNYANALYQCKQYYDSRMIAEALYAEYYDVLGLQPRDIFQANNQEILAMLNGDLFEHQDDIKHLADCLNLTAMCLRNEGRPTFLTAIHAAKFYSVSHSYKSAMKTGQDIADDFLALEDFEGAKLVMENNVLPFLKYMDFHSSVLDVRCQYAVILAYCGDVKASYRELETVKPYISDAPIDHQIGIANQIALIERIAKDRVFLMNQCKKGGKKTRRNDPCPCGSGLKYKKCCLN